MSRPLPHMTIGEIEELSRRATVVACDLALIALAWRGHLVGSDQIPDPEALQGALAELGYDCLEFAGVPARVDLPILDPCEEKARCSY